MDEHRLSVVIPCYNCAETLEEALASVYEQGVSTPFEVVMVDDGSTDNTWELMNELAKKYQNVKCYRHDENQGGGATRNTAIEKSSGDMIFCLDSDDILTPGTLGKMAKMALEKNCDGIGVSTSIKFKGLNKNDIAYVSNFGYIGEKIPFESLLQKDGSPLCPLYSTFLHTKKAFETIGGYPTDHGFDTQGFAWRFLANGLVAYACPETKYLHRVNFHKSYYLREYEAGKANHNWFRIYEEFLFLFRPEAQDVILSFNLNSDDSLPSSISQIDSPFRNDYREYLAPEGRKRYKEKVKNNTKIATGYDLYWLGAQEIAEKKIIESLTTLGQALNRGMSNPHLYKKLLELGYSFTPEDLPTIRAVIKKMETYHKKHGVYRLMGKATKVAILIKKTLKNISLVKKMMYWFYGIKNNIGGLKDRKRYLVYRKEIEDIIKNREIVFGLKYGGLGDCLVYTSLPRLLAKRYGIIFYLDESTKKTFRHNDIFRICFESNPYFKGFKKTKKPFYYQRFAWDRSLVNLLLDLWGESISSIIERQFGVYEKGLPEIYYQPKKMAGYDRTVLADLNYVSGHALGWKYDQIEIEQSLQNYERKGYKIIRPDPKKQDIFSYADMVFSAEKFVTVLSGGAALAAAMKVKAEVRLPVNVRGESVYNFVFKNSEVSYE